MMNSEKIKIEDLIKNYDKTKHYIKIKKHLEDGSEKIDVYVYPASWCEICQCTIHKYNMMHKKTKKHLINAGLLNRDEVFKPDIRYCEVCNMHFKSKETFYVHCKKTSHKKALEIEQRLKEKLLKNDS